LAKKDQQAEEKPAIDRGRRTLANLAEVESLKSGLSNFHPIVDKT